MKHVSWMGRVEDTEQQLQSDFKAHKVNKSVNIYYSSNTNFQDVFVGGGFCFVDWL